MLFDNPALTRLVVTVYAPFRSPRDSFFLPLRQVAPLWPCDVAAFVEAAGRRPSVPSTCFYTVADGAMTWSSCLDPETPADCLESPEVHLTMATNPRYGPCLRNDLYDR